MSYCCIINYIKTSVLLGLLLGVPVDSHEEDGVGGTFVDEVHEGEVGDEAAWLRRPRGTEPKDR